MSFLFTIIESIALTSQEKISHIQSYSDEQINALNAEGENALYTAVANAEDDPALVFWLAEQQPHQANHIGQEMSAVHLAAKLGKTEILESFFNKGIKFDSPSSQGFFPIHYAAAQGHIQTITKLIQLNPKDFYLTTTLGNNFVHVACTFGQLGVLKNLLNIASHRSIPEISHLYILNLPNTMGHYPLHIATHSGHKDLVEWLLQNHKIDIGLQTQLGQTTFVEIAVKAGHFELLTYFTNHSAFGAEVKKLLQKPNKKGLYPLHVAAAYGQTLIADWLIRTLKVSPHLRELDTLFSFFQRAASKKQLGFLKYFADHAHLDPDLKISLLFDQTDFPFHIATKQGDIPTVEWLISLQHINLKDGMGNNFVHLAATFGYLELLKYFARHPSAAAQVKVMLHEANLNGFFPLHLATLGKHIELVEWLLLEQGVNLHCVETNENDSFIHIAARMGDENFLKPFLYHPLLGGAIKTMLQKTNKAGLCPKEVAQLNKQTEVVKWLEREERIDTHFKNHIKLGVHTAIKEGDIELLNHFFSHPILGASAKQQLKEADETGRFPLHIGAANGDSKLVEYLLCEQQLNPNVKQRDGSGGTFIHEAVNHGHYKFLGDFLTHPDFGEQTRRMLLEPNRQGLYALHLATKNQDISTVDWLLCVPSMDFNLTNRSNQTFVKLALDLNFFEFLENFIHHPIWGRQTKLMIYHYLSNLMTKPNDYLNFNKIINSLSIFQKMIPIGSNNPQSQLDVILFLLNQKILTKDDLLLADFLSYLDSSEQNDREIFIENFDLIYNKLLREASWPSIKTRFSWRRFEKQLIKAKSLGINLDNYAIGEIIAQYIPLSSTSIWIKPLTFLLMHSPNNFIKAYQVYNKDDSKIISLQFILPQQNIAPEILSDCSKWGLLIERGLERYTKSDNHLPIFFNYPYVKSKLKMLLMLKSYGFEKNNETILLPHFFQKSSHVFQNAQIVGVFVPEDFNKHALTVEDLTHYILLLSTLLSYGQGHQLFQKTTYKALADCIELLIAQLALQVNLREKLSPNQHTRLCLSIDRLKLFGHEVPPKLLVLERQCNPDPLPSLQDLAFNTLIRLPSNYVIKCGAATDLISSMCSKVYFKKDATTLWEKFSFLSSNSNKRKADEMGEVVNDAENKIQRII